MSDPKEGNAWHADHIVAVFQGGGNFGFYGCLLFNFLHFVLKKRGS